MQAWEPQACLTLLTTGCPCALTRDRKPDNDNTGFSAKHECNPGTVECYIIYYTSSQSGRQLLFCNHHYMICSAVGMLVAGLRRQEQLPLHRYITAAQPHWSSPNHSPFQQCLLENLSTIEHMPVPAIYEAYVHNTRISHTTYRGSRAKPLLIADRACLDFSNTAFSSMVKADLDHMTCCDSRQQNVAVYMCSMHHSSWLATGHACVTAELLYNLEDREQA